MGFKEAIDQFRRRVTEILADHVAAVQEDYNARLRQYRIDLGRWITDLYRAPLGETWRIDFNHFLDAQESLGYVMRPDQRRKAETWIERRAIQHGLLPRTDDTAAPALARKLSSDNVGDEPSGPGSAPPSGESAHTPAKPAGPPSNWPALSPQERERNRAQLGISRWWPVPPVNLADRLWEADFETLGRESRQRLLAVFTELAALGRQAALLDKQEEPNLDPLEIGGRRVQVAYDGYIDSLTELRRHWNKYLGKHSTPGIHVTLLVGKILAALPDHVADLKSPRDAALKAAFHENRIASRKAVSRLDFAYGALRVTDTAVTVVEVGTVVVGIAGAAAKVATEQLAKGVARRAAYAAAIKFAAKQLVVQGTIAYGTARLLPPVLSASGLNEDEIRAGLLVLQGLQALRALRALQAAPKKPSPSAGGSAKPKAKPGTPSEEQPPTAPAKPPIVGPGVKPAELVSDVKPPFPSPVADVRVHPPRSTGLPHPFQVLGEAAETALAKWVHSLPDEAVIMWGHEVQAPGADVISYNLKTKKITLWDSKHRSDSVLVRKSTTHSISTNLGNALEIAKDAIEQSGLNRLQKEAAIASIDNWTFNTRTAGMGNAKNSTFGDHK